MAAKYPGYRTMTGAERRNARMHRIFEEARGAHKPNCTIWLAREWQGSPYQADPDNFWVCDDCGGIITASIARTEEGAA